MVILFFVISFVATMLSVMSGGGASTINIPAFISLGVSVPLASSLQKTSSIFWVIPTALRYLKGKTIDWIFLLYVSLAGLIGVYFGVKLVFGLPHRVFEIVVGVIIILLVFYSYRNKSFGIENKEKVLKKVHPLFAIPFGFVVGLYESFFGAGGGIMFAVAVGRVKGLGLKESLGYYFLAAWLWNVYAAYLFISKGYFEWSLMIAVVLGSFLGALLGSWYASRKSNTFIKKIFQAVGLLLALKLLVGI